MTIDASKVTLGDEVIDYVDKVGIVVDAKDASRVFTVDGERLNVTFKNIEITNGNDATVGGLYANGFVTIAPNITFYNSAITSNVGGGAYIGEGSILRMYDSVVAGNTDGPGLTGRLNSTMLVVDSLVANNTNEGGLGGGISSANGVVRLVRSTVDGNSANVGAGVYAAHLITDRSTITNNTAYGADGLGGAVVTVSSAQLVNTLVADNKAVDSAVYGGVVALRNAWVDAYNATIVNNGGVDLRLSAGASANMYNTIVGLTDGAVSLDANAKGANAYNTLSAFTDWTKSENAYAYNGAPIFVGDVNSSATGKEKYKLNGTNFGKTWIINQAINTGANAYVDAANGYSTWDIIVGIDEETGEPIYANEYVDLAGDKRIFDGVDDFGQTVAIVDLGAYESNFTMEKPSIIVTTLDDVVNPYDHWISLREAVEVYFHYRELADGSVRSQRS